MDLSPYDLESFVDFIFRNAVKMDDWCKNYVYEMYVRENNKKESVDRAAERVILINAKLERTNRPSLDRVF